MRKPHPIRKFILKILIFVFAALAIPTAITLSVHGKIGTRIYSPSESGKYVTVTLNGVTENLDVEDFLPCAVMGQLSVDNEEELLKCFTVIMRTYILSSIAENGSDSIEADKLEIPYITYAELEKQWGESFPERYNYLMKIVSNTSLETVKNDSGFIKPYYHSVSAGKTRSGSEVMGDEYGYLCQASCPDDNASPDYFKAYYYDNREFSKLVRSIDGNISIDETAPMETVQIVKRDSAGYVLTLSIGNVSLDGTEFYEKMNINSPAFMIEEYNGGVRITTYGKGHGLGVCLNHASAMAAAGSSYKEILNYFYTNVKI